MYKSIHSQQYATLQTLLRQARSAAGLTQAELAQRLEWSQADISKVESGVRRLDVIELRTWLAALGQTLAVPAAQLTVAARQGKRLQRQDGLPAARGGRAHEEAMKKPCAF